MDPTLITGGLNAATGALNLAAKLAEIQSKTPYAWVEAARDKARRAQTKEEAARAYEEIISQYAQANAEYENLARGYKEMYEQVVIRDEDIQFLHRTLSQIIDAMSAQEQVGAQGDVKDAAKRAQEAAKKAQDAENLKAFLTLVNKDTLKTMQLLGFNYREAIGAPLTKVCSDFILTKLGTDPNNTRKRK